MPGRSGIPTGTLYYGFDFWPYPPLPPPRNRLPPRARPFARSWKKRAARPIAAVFCLRRLLYRLRRRAHHRNALHQELSACAPITPVRTCQAGAISTVSVIDAGAVGIDPDLAILNHALQSHPAFGQGCQAVLDSGASWSTVRLVWRVSLLAICFHHISQLLL